MATGKVCSKCGKRNHLSCVCRSSKQTDVAKTADKLVDEANWACSVSQDTELHSPSDTYPPCDNKNAENTNSSSHKNYSKEVNNKEKIGVTHPGPPKRGKQKKNIKKKVGLPTLVQGTVSVQMAALDMTLLTGSVIHSSPTSGIAELSRAQVAHVS